MYIIIMEFDVDIFTSEISISKKQTVSLLHCYTNNYFAPTIIAKQYFSPRTQDNSMFASERRATIYIEVSWSSVAGSDECIYCIRGIFVCLCSQQLFYVQDSGREVRGECSDPSRTKLLDPVKK